MAYLNSEVVAVARRAGRPLSPLVVALAVVAVAIAALLTTQALGGLQQLSGHAATYSAASASGRAGANAVGAHGSAHALVPGAAAGTGSSSSAAETHSVPGAVSRPPTGGVPPAQPNVKGGGSTVMSAPGVPRTTCSHCM